MDNIEYVEEEKKVVVATGTIPKDDYKNDLEKRNRVFKVLEAVGYDLEDRENLEIEYEMADDESISFSVSRVTKEMIPYKVEMDELYSNTFILNPSSMDQTAQKRQIFTMMLDDGVEIDPTADYEISYEETENYDKDNSVKFTVFKYNREKILDDESLKIADYIQDEIDTIANTVNDKDESIIYEEESEIEEIFSGSFILDGIRMTEEEQKKKVMSMMETAGVVVNDGDKIDIGYEGAEDFEDGMSTRFVVIRETKKVVPYKIESEKVYSGEYVLDNIQISPSEQRERIFDMMRAEGIPINDKSELDIRYEGASDFDEGMSTKFDVYRMKKIRLDEKKQELQVANTEVSVIDEDSQLASEIIEVEEIEMEEIVNGTLDLDGLKSQEEIDNKVFEILKVSGVEVGNVGEVKVSYGEKTDDNKLPFTVSRVIVEKVKYNVDKTMVGKGVKKEKEDIFAAVQRNQGLDIRLDPNYEIVYGQSNEIGREYTLIKTNRTKLESTLVSPKEEFENNELEDKKDIIELVDSLYDSASLGADSQTSETSAEIINMETVNNQFYESQREEANGEFAKLTEALEKIASVTKDSEEIDNLLNLLDSLEKEGSEDLEFTGACKEYLNNISNKIKDTRKFLKQAEKDYETSFLRMQELVRSEREEFERNNLLSDDELQKVREMYAEEQLREQEVAVAVKKQIEQGKRQLTSLTRRKNKIEKGILKAEALELSLEEYRDIVGAVSKRKVMDAILSSKGLSEIIDKPLRERTSEEKQLLLEAKDEIISEIAKEQRNSSSEKSLSEVIEALYAVDDMAVTENKARNLKVNNEMLRAIETNSMDLPEKVVSAVAKNNNYVPGDAPKDMVEVSDLNSEKAASEMLEKILVYVDLEHGGKKYVRKSVLDRFNLRKNEKSINVNNATFYRISDDDAEFIIGNADNEYSPYEIEFSDVPVNSADAKKEEEKVVDNKLTNLEKIVIYKDLDNNVNFAKKHVFDRFNLEIKGDETLIELATCYKLNDADLNYIVGNADNDYSPYDIEYREVHLGKVEDNIDEVVDNDSIGNEENAFNDNELKEEDEAANEVDDENNQSQDEEENELDNEDLDIVSDDNSSDDSISEETEEIREEIITLYRDLNDNNQIYAGIDVLNKFGIVPTEEGKKIKDKDCYKISSDTNKMINYVANTSVNPKYIVNYENVKLKKKVVPHVETILDKITTGLEIKAKDVKKFNASNIKIAENFKNDLKSGNALYNIVHIIPATVKAATSFLRKLSGSLMSRGRVKKVMTELNRRLDEDLSEEELDVLFNEYRGSQLKTDMNHQINDMILRKLREHGLGKVSDLNDKIKYSYSNIFTLLGQIKVVDQKLVEGDLEKKEKDALLAEKTKLIDKAASHVKDVLISRKDANNLLSGGVHGLEEDFKAVSTKLSYVGMRFAKTNDFDNELQHKLGEYGENLSEALSEGDNEAILTNFMGLESCYYKNTEVARSMIGRRSIGSKYYSPLAEQFDYRDDPFIRDVMTTVVFASAAGSAINASLVHQFKAKELLDKQNIEASRVNSSNDSIIDYVHQTGADIEGKRGIFQDGMEAQAHQDVLSSANSIERASLDMSNWKFNDVYHAADEAGHSFYNEFSQNVTSQINDITARYGSGSINQVEALHEMAKVANSAQSTLANVSSECSNIMKAYAETHPQFDLSAIQDSLDYVVAHPDAINDMNQAMLDVTNLAGGLEGLTLNHVEALASLPSDMSSTLVCAASAAGLALRVSNVMASNYGKKGVYGNEITDMMEEYVSDLEEDSLEDIETKGR